MATSFFALLLGPKAWPAQSMAIRADRHDTEGHVLVFYDGDRPVHRVPAGVVVRIEPHATKKAADLAVKAFREASVGGATIHVEEAGPAIRPKASSRATARGDAQSGATSAIPAEGISFKIEE